MASARFAYINTRISTMVERLISPALFNELIDQPGAAGMAALEQLNLTVPDTSAALEQLLLTRLLDDFQILTRPIIGPERDFLEYLVRWFELTNLKVIIRGKYSGEPDHSIREKLMDIGPFAILPTDELLRTEDPAEMLRRLETTPFSDFVRQARKAFAERQDLFALDASLDHRFFCGLRRRAGAVAEGERAAVRDIMQALLDRFNLLWLLRYRFSYHLSPAETYYLLVPTGHDLDSDKLFALSQLSSFSEVIMALPQRLGKMLLGVKTFTEVENCLVQHTERVARRHLGDIRHAIARAFAYLLLREIEMGRLLAILNGKRLGFHHDKIRFAAGLI